MGTFSPANTYSVYPLTFNVKGYTFFVSFVR